MARSLEGRVVVLVGSSTGMGRATALRFAQAGAYLALGARSADLIEGLAHEIGDTAIAVPTDVQDGGAVDRLVAAAHAQFGRIDVLVYLTGTNVPDRSLDRLTRDAWEMMLRTNLTGAFYCTQAVLPVMRVQRDGLIIYVSSAAVQHPDTSGVSYQASKHGLVGLAHGTFREERHHGIRTSVIFPGLTDTPILRKRPVRTPDDIVAKALRPEDVAEACLFVASLPARAYVPELVIVPSALA